MTTTLNWLIFSSNAQLLLACLIAVGLGWAWIAFVNWLFKKPRYTTRAHKQSYPSFKEIHSRFFERKRTLIENTIDI